MTSNERKILECIWNRGGEVHICLISSKTGFSSDYSYFLCRALKNAGHLEFSGHTFCRLSEKGHKYFEESADDPALSSILSDDKDEDEGRIDSNPPADDGGAARETEENVPRNDIKHEEEATEKPIVNPIDNSIGLMIKRFVGLLKKSIKAPESGNVVQGTTRHQ